MMRELPRSFEHPVNPKHIWWVAAIGTVCDMHVQVAAAQGALAGGDLLHLTDACDADAVAQQRDPAVQIEPHLREWIHSVTLQLCHRNQVWFCCSSPVARP